MMRATPLVLLLLLLPAATAAPVSGSLRFEDPPSIEGELALRASPALMDLSGAGASLSLSWSGARGVHEGYEGVAVGVGAGVGTERWSSALSFGSGGLRVLSCLPGCAVLVFSPDNEGAAGFAGRFSGSLERLAVPASRTERVDAEGVGAALRTGMESARLEVEGGKGLVPFVEGRARILLWNATVEVVEGSRSFVLKTGERRAPSAHPLLPAWRVNTSHAVLDLEGVSLDAPSARLLAEELAASVAGNVSSRAASGWLEVDGRRVFLAREPVALGGRIHLNSSLLRAGLGQDGGVHGALSGNAEWVRLGRGLVASDPLPGVGAGLAVAAAVLLLLALKGGLVPFYSRLTGDSLLANENRRRLHRLVSERPGASLVQLAGAAGLGRMVALYHLRILEQHRLVAADGKGRLRLYFPAHGRARSAPSSALLRVLRDPTRRSLALALRDTPAGCTQAELASVSGASQRLVSYHVRVLEKNGLVEGSEGRPRRFRATPVLTGALQA